MRLGLGLGSTKRPANPIEAAPGFLEWLALGQGIASSGGRVDSWTGARGAVAAKVSDPTRPSTTTEAGSTAVDFVFANASELLLPLSLGTSFSAIFVFRSGARTSQAVAAFEAAGAVKQGQVFTDAPGTTMYWQVLTGTARTASTAYVQGQLESWAVVVTPTRADIFRNWTKTTSPGGSTLAAAVTQVRLGSIALAGYYSEGNLLDAVFLTGDPGDAKIQELDAYLRTLRGVP